MKSTRSGPDNNDIDETVAYADAIDRPPSSSALHDEARKTCELLREIANRTPRIVVLGEGNSGKTTLANRLVGSDLLPESMIGNGRFSMLIRFSNEIELHAVGRDGTKTPIEAEHGRLDGEGVAYLELGLPAPRLRTFEVFDAHHRATPEDVLSLARPGTLQIPVWCTVATQAWKNSEQQTWMTLHKQARMRGMLAVTCCDRIADNADRSKLLDRLSRETSADFAVMALAPDPWVGTTPIEETMKAHADRLVMRRRLVAGRLSRRIIRLGNALGGGGLPLVAAV